MIIDLLVQAEYFLRAERYVQQRHERFDGHSLSNRPSHNHYIYIYTVVSISAKLNIITI